MGVEGCTKCIKYMLFFFNFIFWLAGGVILGVALWLRHDNKTSSLLDLQYEGTQAPNTFYISVHILIAVGAVMMVVGFLGCYGAIQESQCLLGTFFACLVILFACEVAAGIWGFMHKDTVSKEMINFYDSIYDKAAKPDFVNDEKKQTTVSVLQVFHETLSCCGKGGVDKMFTFLTDAAGLTNVCPDSFKTISCHDRIKELFSDRIYLIGIAALVIAVIMIFEMIFSMVLCCGIRNSPVY
ncbi:CD81 molecule a [Sphaeramia orbicularis]|uniref:Tetraspanin n=1 Tax=Sphaeramia orbicularis TaxID=375764 RepID=A0A672YAM6_9TELE|nr:CD81 antigen [Sphaeramia orbicularis]